MAHSAPRQIRLSRRTVLAFAAVITFFAGTLFSGAAAAAGVQAPDMLALCFALGGCTTMFLLLVWYITQVGRAQERRAPKSRPLHSPYDRGPAWMQARRPPSGSTIMWAANLLRRRSDLASHR